MSTAEAPIGTRRIYIRLPAAIPHHVLLISALSLFVLQLLSGTDPVFGALVFAFVEVSGLVFNLSGGFHSIPGFALAMMSLKTVIIAQLGKLVLWQPADSLLEVPQLTLAMFVLGFLSLGFGVVVGLRARGRGLWIPPITEARQLLLGTFVCFLVGAASAGMIWMRGIDTATEELGSGGLLGLAYIFVRMLPMSIVFATAYAITKSRGERSISPLVVATVFISMGFAALQGTKQGVFETVLFYILTCVAWRFGFYRRQLIALGFAGLVGLFVVWPVLQTLKNVTLLTSISASERVDLMKEALTDFTSIGEFFEASDEFEDAMSQERFQYFGRAIGWLDRFSLIEPGDELVAATLEQGELGWLQPSHAVRSLVPRVIDPDKPAVDTGNLLGHRIAYLAEGDDATQIAFGIIPESFSSFAWTGVLLIPAILIFVFVIVFTRLSDGYVFSVWGVYLFGRLQHSFVEQSMSTMLRETLVLPLLLVCVHLAIRTVKTVLDMRREYRG